ncbi:aminoglycoside 6'-N-acetyltransferase [Candidatus Leptofilum sp.]|uniref:aminoglycoside 6'-N-acetyltransferase n=1 Tax=Candidatus Leptofilum sp. TaxID=3241576 RepID=UPI003B5A6B70
MKVRELDSSRDMTEWLRLRQGLFDDSTEAEHQQEMAEILAEADGCVLVAERPSSPKLAGYLHVGSRKYAEGCTTSPVAYLEEWFVDADVRRQGVGRALIAAAEAWAQQNGYTELASDTLIENEISLASHLALGFTEVERQINFIKKLD